MKKRILVLALALMIAAPALGKTKFNSSINTDNASFAVSSVTPITAENNVPTTITITGTKFLSTGAYNVKLGQWMDNSKDDTDDTYELTDVVRVSDESITATIPIGAMAENQQDLTVYDSNTATHATLQNAITVHPSMQVNDQDGDNDGIVEVFQSSSKSSKTTFKLTVLGKSFKNKRWLKLKVGSKKAVITKVSRVGTTSVISAKFKYGKMAVSASNISLTYKDRMKYAVTRKNKLTYKNMWETGTMTANNAFSVNSQVH